MPAKRRTTTVHATKLDRHWLDGYVADIGGTRVVFQQRRRDWVARCGWPYLGRILATGRTLSDTVSSAKTEIAEGV